jgi:hypothetical protein
VPQSVEELARPAEGGDVDRPARDLDRVIDRRFDAENPFRESGHDIGGDPRRAEARGDVGGLEVLGQSLFERRDIALIARIKRRGGLDGRELVADLARQIGVGRHPDFSVEGDGRLGIEENAIPQFGDRRLARPTEKLGDAVEIDEARFVQGYGERVLGRLDQRRRLRMEHALAKDRSMLRCSAFEIVILDRGDQPDVRVVEEGLKVRATEGLARLALGRHGLADRRQVDRAEVAHEEGVGRAQPDLRRSPGFIISLGAQNLADGVANRDQAADDAGVLGGDPLRSLAFAHGDRLRLAADDLDEDTLMDEIASLLDRRPFGGRADPHGRVKGRLRFTYGGLEQVARQAVERLGQKVRERARRREDRLQRIDRPIGARGSRMRPERHFGMLDEVAVDRKRRLAVLGCNGFCKNVPGRAGRRGPRTPPLQEQDVDHDVGSGAVVHCAFGHPHRAYQIGHGCNVLARLAIDLVHRPSRCDEGGETA